MSNLRILRVIPVLDFGGVESLFLTQARYWDNASIQVEYLTFWKDGQVADRMRAFGAKVHVLHMDPSIRNPRATWALWRFLRSYKPDLVHSVIGEANFHVMLLAPFSSWRTIIEEGGIPNRTLRNRLVHAGLYRFVDGIIAVSQASKTYVEEREWAPKSRTHLVYNAISKDFFRVRRKQTYNPKRVRFRAVGRLSEVKNFEFLVRVFAKAIESAPHIHLDIVGDGPLRAQLQRQIDQLQTENIKLLGFCDDIPTLHQTTDWLLLPSHSEGFGLVAAEAMAAGVPVIASHVGGLPEVLGDLAKDWSLEPTDTHSWTETILLAAKYDQIDYDHLSNAVRTSAQRFHPDRYVDELARLYRSICEKP